MAERSHGKGEQTPRRVYGRRRGHRLRRNRSARLRDLLPRVAVPLGAPASLDPRDLFDPPTRRARLEIGFGAGEHLAAVAAADPATGFLGSEPYENGVASLLATIEREGLRNIRIHPGDARDLLDALADAVLDDVYLLYPDPWPKRRHRKRRLVSQETLAALARVMCDDAQLVFATDIGDYARWTLACFARHQEFEWTGEGPSDWRNPPDGWPGTRYEAKAVAAGRAPIYLAFRRLPRSVRMRNNS